MDELAARLTALEEQLCALQERVSSLEATPASSFAQQAPLGERLEVLEQLQRRRGAPYEQGERCGAVLYAGAAQLEGREYLWQVERPLPGLLGLDMQALTPVFAALASSARLVLLRALVEKPRSSQELQELLALSSPGPLYHHLKELTSLGVVEQRQRGVYQIAARHVIPFLALLAASFDLQSGSGRTSSALEER